MSTSAKLHELGRSTSKRLEESGNLRIQCFNTLIEPSFKQLQIGRLCPNSLEEKSTSDASTSRYYFGESIKAFQDNYQSVCRLHIHFFTSVRMRNLNILVPNGRFNAIAYRRLKECTFGNIVLQLNLFHLSDKILLKCKRHWDFEQYIHPSGMKLSTDASNSK